MAGVGMIGTGLLLLSLVGLGAGGSLGATALGLRRGVDWLLAALVLATVEATLLTIAVGGILRTYERWALLLGVSACAGALLLVCRARSCRWEGATSAYVAAIRAARQLVWWQRVIVLVSVAAVAWRGLLALTLPPFAYDALVYHLTVVADWVQGGRVEANPYVRCCSHYPSGAETLFAWPALFLDHDLLVDAIQPVLALVAAIAVAGLARWIGLTPSSALTAGATFLLTPIVLTQANTAYNDVALAAFLLAAAFFVVRLLDARCFRLGRGTETKPSAALALLGGGATGLALGTKTSGIAIALILTTLVLAHVAVAAWSEAENRRRLLGTASAFVGAAIVVGGWWYARNWVETGNPVWPFRVSVAEHEIFPGTVTFGEYLTVPPGAKRSWPLQIAQSWYHDLTFWARPDYSYEERNGGLGPLWSWLGWATVAILAAEMVRRRRDVTVNFLLPLLLVFLLLPYKWWSRFTIYLAAVGSIAVVALIERVRPGWGRQALICVVILLGVAGVAQASWMLDPAGRGSTLTAPRVVELAARPSRHRDVGTLFYPEYGFLSKIPEKASVAVDRDAPSIRFLYPFFGSGLDRTVTLLRRGDEARLGAVLTEVDADYVVVGAHDAFDAWLDSHPARYERIVDELDVRVYRRTAA